MSAKIFTAAELYNFCLAEVHGMGMEEDYGVVFDWSDFVDEELEAKFNQLSEAEQEEFETEIKRVAVLVQEDVESLPDNIDTEEKYEELEEEKQKNVDVVANQLSDFLVDD